MCQKKAVVLDASVLLHDPDAFYQFKGVEIYLSTVVIDELVRKKNLHDEVGKNARYVMRILHRFLKQKRREGQVVVLNQDLRINILFFDLKKKVKDFSLMLDRPANIFLYQIYNLQKENIKPILVSKDSVLKIKAEALEFIHKTIRTWPSPLAIYIRGYVILLQMQTRSRHFQQNMH